MKHSIILGLLAVVMATGFVVTPAQAEMASTTATTTVATSTVATSTVATTTATTTAPVVASSRIADLLAQLAKLTAIFNDLKAKLMGVTAELHELKGDLKDGKPDADIKAIQEAFASDPSIYPSGLKTGYFGPMTKEAIKKFQAKNGLEVTGEINAETKAALDTIMATRHKEGKFPLGLLIAPGQYRKDFENRFRSQCGVMTASSTVAAKCVPFKGKYKFDMDDKDDSDVEEDDDNNSTSTPAVMRPMKPGEKKEDTRGRKMHSASSTADQSDDDEDDN